MKKYLITGFVVVCLCVVISTVFAKKQSYKGVQWEYGMYVVCITVITEPRPQTGLVRCEWMTSEGWLVDKSGRDVWHQAGFKWGDKAVTQFDWFDFLGSQGWELLSVGSRDEDYDVTAINKNTYWFKRLKK